MAVNPFAICLKGSDTTGRCLRLPPGPVGRKPRQVLRQAARRWTTCPFPCRAGRDRRAPRPQRRRQDDDHQHDPRRARADRRAGSSSRASISAPTAARRWPRTNFAAVYAPLPGNLTVEQNLRVFGLIYDVEALDARIEELLADYDLDPIPPDQGGRALVGRADASLARQGDAEPRRGCCCSTSRRRRSIRRPRATSAPASPISSKAAIAACCGRATTCTRSRRSATGCCSCRTGGSCSKAIRRRCRASTASADARRSVRRGRA